MRAITYCLSCKKDTRNIDPKVVKTTNNKQVIISRCSICNNKKSPQNRMKNAFWNAFR